MSGHSHWAGIKHKKAATDAKKGKVWSRLAKAIIVAARMGGGNPDANSRLRLAIADAKAVSMPKENIERAIRRGTGEGSATQLEEIIYEGYGPGGVAVLCEVLTDNRNRTAPEIRKMFDVSGGKLGATGCVAWMFDRKGVFTIPADQTDEEKLMELALELGADDVQEAGDGLFEVTCSPDQFVAVADGLTAAGIRPESQQITRIPKDTVVINDVDVARKVMRLIEQLEDHDDVQTAATNFDIPEEIAGQLD
ncbi:MAG: YebC/PmpR family DNA-binding transcriptional regulator [Planctomycetia bacterium]|nr:YebC/PmpR family DNA-binding transcriptional regulator [Planctomycetia bacterium]